MAGHSKWANIKFRKAAQDKKRGKMFTKLIREITVAARVGGGDVDNNPRLRTAIDKALAANMTRDTIDRAVRRGAGGGEGANVEEIRYEGYGPEGVAVLVDCMTDNRNRTVAEVRHAFTKCGGNLGADGSVAYMFTNQGQITFAPGSDEDRIIEAAIDAGAEDVVVNEDKSIDVITAAKEFSKIKDVLEKAGLKAEHAETTMEAATKVTLNKDGAEKIMRMVDMFEDLDDAQEVYTNADIPDEILALME
jgi:YebC/PmpR family DNA-binding regulatory protein